MTGFHEDQAAYVENPQILVGTRGRVASLGQEYLVVGIVDEATALIEIKTWDEPLPYPVSEIAFDLAGNCTRERFLPLVGRYKTMGPDGPTYQVVSIVDNKTAKVWIVPEDDDEDYKIEDILIDPAPAD